MAANWQKKSNLYPFVNTAAAGPSGGDTMLYVSGSSKSTLSDVPSISKGGVNTTDVHGIIHSDSSNTVHVIGKEDVNITDVSPDNDIVVAKGGVNTTGIPVIREC